MSTETAVTVADVRMELSDTKGALDSGLIAYHLDRAAAHVNEAADETASTARIQDAIAVEAAYRVITSNKDAFGDAKNDGETEKGWDVSTYIEQLESRRDNLLDDVESGEGGSDAPRLRTFGSRRHD